MRAHIVGTEIDGERILARLAKVLASGTGWSLSEKPDPHADVNVFQPYLLVPKAGYVETLTAAYFTHREDNLPPKVQVWDRAARAVSLRASSAQQYVDALAPLGPTALVTPPLDRATFTPGAPVRRSRRLTVGTSGFTYVGGRKGEALWRALMSALMPAVECVAVGRGWGNATRYLGRAENLAPWYRALDVYVCCSLVEGIPMGPLEALSCGIPVVIPWGVGLLDTLHAPEGIYRYTAGDAKGLIDATKRALADCAAHATPEPEALRATTERFTAEAWCADWVSAVEMLSAPESDTAPNLGEQDEKRRELHPAADVPPLIARRMSRGVVCVAYGPPARACVQKLIASVRQHMPGLPVCLITDAPLGVEDVWAEYPDADLGARSAKTSLYGLAPAEWDSVLYLDADTWLLQSVEPIFYALEHGWDLVMTADPSKYSLARYGVRPDNKDEAAETFALAGTDEFLQLNGGVCGFRRSDEVAAFFATWHTEWLVYAKRDQMALDRALFQHPLRVWLLGRPFNQIVRYGAPNKDTVIAHAPLTARRWIGIVPGRLDGEHARRLQELSMGRHPEPPAGMRVAR